jgi:hypothetical protein
MTEYAIGLELNFEIREPRPVGSYIGPLTAIELCKRYEIHYLVRSSAPAWIMPLMFSFRETSGQNRNSNAPVPICLYNVYTGPGYGNWGKAELLLPLSVIPTLKGKYISYTWHFIIEAVPVRGQYQFIPAKWEIPITILPAKQYVNRNEPYLPWTEWKVIERPGHIHPVLNVLKEIMDSSG